MDKVLVDNLFLYAAMKLSRAKLHHHTIQLLVRSDKPPYAFVPLGSGVLVEGGGQYFIFTAAHVSAEADKRSLYVLARTGVEQVIGTCVESDFKEDANYDVAYIVLEKMLGLLLRETYEFTPLSRIAHSHIGQQTANYMVCGYPASNLWIKDKDTITGSSHFLLGMAGEKVYRFHKQDPATSYVLRFAGKGINIENGERSGKIADPYGMSGAGLWYLRVKRGVRKIELEYFLIGIMTMFKKSKYHVLVGNRVEIIISDIEAKGFWRLDWKEKG